MELEEGKFQEELEKLLTLVGAVYKVMPNVKIEISVYTNNGKLGADISYKTRKGRLDAVSPTSPSSVLYAGHVLGFDAFEALCYKHGIESHSLDLRDSDGW